MIAPDLCSADALTAWGDFQIKVQALALALELAPVQLGEVGVGRPQHPEMRLAV